MNELRLVEGALAVDDRGQIGFANDADLRGIRRFYTVSNHRSGFVRAWHAHRREGKAVTVVQGAALVAAVQIDDWDQPTKDLPVHRHVISAKRPAVLFIPPGYANGAMTLTPDAVLLYLSNATIDESQGDDVRYDARYWDPWRVAER